MGKGSFKVKRGEVEAGEKEERMSKRRGDTRPTLLPAQIYCEPNPRSEMTGKTQPDRHPSKMLERGWCLFPEPGQCYFLGQSKSQRMKADD